MRSLSKMKRLTIPAAIASISAMTFMGDIALAESLPQGFLPASAPKEISGRAATAPIPSNAQDAASTVKGSGPMPPPHPDAGTGGVMPPPDQGSNASPPSNPGPPRRNPDDAEPRRPAEGDVRDNGRISNTPPPSLAPHMQSRGEDHAVDNAYGAETPKKMYSNPPPDYGSSGPRGSQDEEAFEEALRRMAPMSDDQIRRERSHMDSRDRVMAEPANGVIPTPHSGTVSLTLKPGELPPRIGLAPGNATVLTFYDQTGAPWPIVSVTAGNADAFTSSKAGQSGKTNMAVIAPKSSYGYGNLVVTLEGLPVPVIFTVVCGSGVVDYRKDIRIRGRGPNAQEDITEGSSLQPVNDKIINQFLDDLPPKGAAPIKTSNPEVQAWRYKHLIYVRSLIMMSAPDYTQYARSPEGGFAYGIEEYTLRGSPVLQFLRDGRSVYVDLDLGDVE